MLRPLDRRAFRDPDREALLDVRRDRPPPCLRPEPLFFPPPSWAFTVAQARRSASASLTPRFS
ncbi:MAG TPA: hypothetical protein VLT82_13815 [Myxococcaceae bacterium]|nr:hypothetical protein [Myxococcaceae bacterium]